MSEVSRTPDLLALTRRAVQAFTRVDMDAVMSRFAAVT